MPEITQADIDQAAERVRRLTNGDQSAYPIASASCDPDGNIPAIVADLRTLADAYLAQQPSYAAQAAEIASIVSLLQRKLQPAGSPPPGNASMLAAWIIDEAHKELAELRAKLEAAEKERERLSRDLAWRLEQALAWEAVWKELVSAGALNFAASDSKGITRAVEFVRHLAKKLAEADCELTALRTAAAQFEDSRPVDEAWCRANGATLTTGYANTWKFACGIDVIFCTGCDVYLGDIRLETVTTIGQLNHLLAALRPGGAK